MGIKLKSRYDVFQRACQILTTSVKHKSKDEEFASTEVEHKRSHGRFHIFLSGKTKNNFYESSVDVDAKYIDKDEEEALVDYYRKNVLKDLNIPSSPAE